jgi:cell division protein FtsB
MAKKSQLKRIIKVLRNGRIPEFVRNRYFICTAVFVLWLLFFDNNNIISQIQLRYEIWKLDKKIEYYREELTTINKQREQLLQSTASLEKYARETYKMKRENEDLYLIVRE